MKAYWQWLRHISHITTILGITERAEGSMEQQYQQGHDLPRSQARRTQGLASVCIQAAERRLHTQQSSFAASPQVSLVNGSYFESIDTQPLQTICATD